MSIPQFKYFENPFKNAAFIDANCDICGISEHCLDGEYFDNGDDIESVCIECLVKGEQNVNIPIFIKKRLIDHLKVEMPNMNEQNINNTANNRVSELSKTAPVQWIQYNNWPGGFR